MMGSSSGEMDYAVDVAHVSDGTLSSFDYPVM